ncbi:MAG: hypothetical protein ACP5E2_17055 [Terracidiphilus sp.]
MRSFGFLFEISFHLHDHTDRLFLESGLDLNLDFVVFLWVWHYFHLLTKKICEGFPYFETGSTVLGSGGTPGDTLT